MVIISASSTTSTLGPWQTPVEIPRPKGSPPTKVNVLFRPAPALAEPFPGSTSVWGEVIERRDLPLESTPQPGGTR